jgi:hypothetical protein
VVSFSSVLWRIDRLLGSDRETKNETTFAARQQFLISKNRRPLLGNGSVNIPVTTDTHATIELILETAFSTVVHAEGF